VKTIGLIGGMSWESTLDYYRIINEEVRRLLGGQHSAPIVMVSLDFHPIERFQHEGRWGEMARCLSEAAVAVARGGADLFLICTNTMHRVAAEVQEAVQIPLLHIADATSEAVREQGLACVGLLGTRFTMEQAFYRERLTASGGFQVLTPDDRDRGTTHRIIYEELCQGILRDDSRDELRGITMRLASAGAEGVILGCTELPMILKPKDAPIPTFDTTRIHACKAVDLALEGP
jgi:aspartate racemase